MIEKNKRRSMPALNFKKRFEPMIESGDKRQTIRAKRKDCRDPKEGQTLYLYTGMRSKGCRKLGEAPCLSSETNSNRRVWFNCRWGRFSFRR